MNIEKLARQYDLLGADDQQAIYTYDKDYFLSQLEDFAKAYAQQSSEPVAFRHRKYPDCVYGSLESFTIHHADKSLAKPLFDHPPASVPLEKYNKLLDAFEEVDRKAQAGLCYFDLNTVREFHKDIRRAYAQAIAEAEEKEG